MSRPFIGLGGGNKDAAGARAPSTASPLEKPIVRTPAVDWHQHHLREFPRAGGDADVLPRLVKLAQQRQAREQGIDPLRHHLPIRLLTTSPSR